MTSAAPPRDPSWAEGIGKRWAGGNEGHPAPNDPPPMKPEAHAAMCAGLLRGYETHSKPKESK